MPITLLTGTAFEVLNLLPSARAGRVTSVHRTMAYLLVAMAALPIILAARGAAIERFVAHSDPTVAAFAHEMYTASSIANVAQGAQGSDRRKS